MSFDPTALFDLSKPVQKIRVPRGATGGLLKLPPESTAIDYSTTKYHSYGQAYVKEIQAKDEKEYADSYFQTANDTEKTNEHSPDYDPSVIGTVVDVNDLTVEQSTQVYENYDFNYRKPNSSTKSLTIQSYREKIMNMIGTHPFIIIQGYTGCGKTTQVPQFILDYHQSHGTHCNIIVTQPRRIAAKSVAEHVSSERGFPIGTVVGYQVGLDNKTGNDTRLTYCTTGVLLQKLVAKKSLKPYTHIILDEVHERDEDTDFAILVVRKLFRMNSREVRVILMSATIDVEKIADYFSVLVNNKSSRAPIITIPKGCQYKVQEHYLDHLTSLGKQFFPKLEANKPTLHKELVELFLRLISTFDYNDEKDYSNGPSKAPDFKSVLVFLPGIFEIEYVFQKLEEYQHHTGGKIWRSQWFLIPLHSAITDYDQKSVFKAPEDGCRKIILSTNIAESSITVPDAVYVVDFCLTKVLSTDSITNYPCLKLEWAARSNCIQRSGRVGRVAEGTVYRMITSQFYEQVLEDHPTPEIQRSPLAQVILKAKLLDIGPPKDILGLAMDPPDIQRIETDILRLKEARALLNTCRGKENPYDGDITFLGRIMAGLPLDISLSKLIGLGYVFNVLEDVIIIAACSSLKTPFDNPFLQRLKAYQSRLSWSCHSCSDSIALIYAYKRWSRSRAESIRKGPAGRKEEKSFCKNFYLQPKVLQETATLIRELTHRLKNMRIETPRGQGAVQYTDVERAFVVKLVLAGAFYPNYFLRGGTGGQIDEREAVRTLAGCDPSTSVLLSGFPHGQPGDLYTQSIRSLFSSSGASRAEIKFDGQRVYVQFAPPATLREMNILVNDKGLIPGHILKDVYIAVKMRQINENMTIYMLSEQASRERLKSIETSTRSFTNVEVALPDLDEPALKIIVYHVNDPNNFWVQTIDHNAGLLADFITQVNENTDKLLPVPATTRIGSLVLALFKDVSGTFYYRARIESVHNAYGVDRLEVFFVDYGNYAELDWQHLRQLSPELERQTNGVMFTIPLLAFQCSLAEVGPLPMGRNVLDTWDAPEIKKFIELAKMNFFNAKVYSVVRGVVAVEIYKGSDSENTLNKLMIDRKIGQWVEESFLSKENHMLRLAVQQSGYYGNGTAKEQPGKNPHSYVDAPTKEECQTEVSLKGPYSPLEMKVYSAIKSGRSRSATVNWDSVNSVLLDADPKDPHERMLIAGHVTENPDNTKLNLHNTTLMPNIHGLPAICAMLFAPTIELRADKDYNRFTGVLCGLGADKHGNAVYPDHDMELVFDTHFDKDDLLAINRMRINICNILRMEEGQDVPFCGENDVLHCQRRLKNLLFESCLSEVEIQHGHTSVPGLLRRRRMSVVPVPYAATYHWNRIPEHKILRADQASSAFSSLYPGHTIATNSSKYVFPLHNAVDLKNWYGVDKVELKKNLKDLEEKSARSKVVVNLLCHVCARPLFTPEDIRLHLATKTHLENVNYWLWVAQTD